MGVYFIKGGRLVKIGSAVDVDQRLKQLQIGSPSPLSVLYWNPDADQRMEKRYHEQLETHRRQGEWFEARPVIELLRSEGVSLRSGRKKLKLPKIFNQDEVVQLLMRAEEGKKHRGPRDRLCLELMYRAGLRISEAVSITPWQINREECTIKILESKSGEGTAYFNGADLLPAVDRWLAERAAFGLLDTDPLICHPSGKRVSTRYYQLMIQKMKKECRIRTQCTPHVFRHTFATERLREGYSVPQVQRLLRHANQANTEIYLHVLDTELQEKMQSGGGVRLGRPVNPTPDHAAVDALTKPEPTLSDLMAKLAEMEEKLNDRP